MLTKFFRIFIKGVSCFYFFVKYTNFKVAYVLAFNHFPLKLSDDISVKNQELVFSKTNNKISVQHLHKFSSHLPILVQVLNHTSSKVISCKADSFVLQFEDLLLNVYSVANIFTIQEIFIDRIYDIFVPQDKMVLIDIGMNVGCAALFFSQLPFIDEIFGYEPFPDTFLEARDNLLLNPILSSKIKPYSYGVSNFSGQVDVAVFESGSAVANIHTQAQTNNPGQKVTLQIKNITDILDEVFLSNQDANIILKVDCEGEEYVIVDSLSESGYLKNIPCLIIEWHVKGAHAILNTLCKNGFATIHLPKSDNQSGMIYAFK